MPRISRRRFVAAATGPVVLALTAGGFLLAQLATASKTITVQVNAGSSLGTVPSAAKGMNTGVYDGGLNHGAVVTALKNAGVDALRYPGGSTSDAYHWQDNSTVSGQGYANPGNGFDDFMGIAQKVGASPVITVNYGSGTAAEAAAWVKYANVTKGYGIKYWELGNENYGDGTYGADWEYNTKPKGATAYANNIADYITQMRAVDPSIKLGAVLTTSGMWPDGLVASSRGDSADWNQSVLQKDGANIDFVILHYYPSSTSDASMLTQYKNIASIVQEARKEINEYAGGNAANIQIMVTETNSGYAYDSVPAALYGADTYMTLLQNGVANVDWWDLHNGAGSAGTNADGSAEFGDSAILSSGNCVGSACEPAADTPFPSYYGVKAVGDLAPAGAEMVATASSDSTVTAYAVKRPDGGMNVMLVNHSPDTSEPVSLTYNGFTAGGVTSAEQFSEGSKQMTSLTGISADGLTLPAYSVTVLKTAHSTSHSSVISLRAHANNMIVTAENTGSAPLIANRTAIGTWEEFDLINNPDGSISFRAHANNDIVTAENGGAAPLIANRTAIGPWEEFDLINNPDGSISLRAHANNMIVTAENAGAAPLIANRTAIGSWEEFDLIHD
jgi:hypothetical protein